MNGVHDMGGYQCFGSVDPDDQHAYHCEWEKQILAITVAMGATGTWNLDESRAARESLPAPFYLSAGYYKIWLAGLESLLLTHGLASKDELTSGITATPITKLKRKLVSHDVASVLARGAPVDRPALTDARFCVGNKVQVRNLHQPTHTRLPGYIRQRMGEIVRVHGCHVFPDSNAIGEGENPQWLYNVRFDNKELWGQDAHAGSVHVDCWEPYLDSV